MTDREHFLERWSRKKAEAEREAPAAPAQPDAADVSLPGEPGVPERRAADGAKSPAEAATKPEFDLASLPSLESITAATDIRAFLTPGVPKELARAALRRAWSADPAIRDFVGLAENAWDFTDPTAMPGFGELPPGYDVKKLLAQLFSEGNKPADPDAAADQLADPQTPRVSGEIMPPASTAEAEPRRLEEDNPSSPVVSTEEVQAAEAEVVQRDNIIASHKSNNSDESEERKNRRTHGSALPQ